MDQHDIEILRQEIGFLRQQLERTEKKLIALAQAENEPTPPATSRSDSPSPTPQKTSPPSYVPKESSRPRPTPESPSVASRFLGFVAVFCFVLAASFLIKLAIDSGWLTPARQLGMAALFGFSLIVLGLRFKTDDSEYLSLLPGAGIVILHMTAYAGRLYYELYDDWMATYLAGAVSIVSLSLYHRFQQEFYVVVAVIGSYLSPFLLPSLRGTDSSVMTFFIVWDVAFAFLSYLLKSRAILLLSAYLALGSFSFNSSTFLRHGDLSELLPVAIFQALQFFIFLVGVGAYSIKRKEPLSAADAWAFFPLLLFFYGIEYSIIVRFSPDLAPWIAITFAALIYAIHYSTRTSLRKATLESENMVNAFVAIVLFHAFYLELLPDRFSPWFALMLMASFAWVKKHLDLKERDLIVGLVILAIIGINFGKILIGSDPAISSFEWSALNLLYFTFLFGAYGQSSDKGNEMASPWSGMLVLANSQALVGLYRLAHQFSKYAGIETMERFVVSILWGLFALAILLWAKKDSDRVLARSSLFIFGISAGKVLLVDVSSAGSVTRIICLLSLGAALYVGGYLFRHIERWET